MSGPDPKGMVELVIEPDEDFSFVLEALEDLVASSSYSERQLAISARWAVIRIKDRLATARKRAEEAEEAIESIRRNLLGAMTWVDGARTKSRNAKRLVTDAQPVSDQKQPTG